MMNDFVKMLILSYLKEKKADYSLIELHDLLGVSMSKLDEWIDELIDSKLIMYNERTLLTPSFEGRILLINSKMEKYKFEINEEDNNERKTSEDDVYLSKSFFKSKWRGRED